MRISDWSSDVCSSDLKIVAHKLHLAADPVGEQLPAFEIILGHAVLDRHDRIAVAKLGEIFRHFGRSESPALARHLIAAVLEELGGGAVQRKHHLLARLVARSEEHTSELQSLMRISYAASCL